MFTGLFVNGYDPCTDQMKLPDVGEVLFPMQDVANQFVDMQFAPEVGNIDFTPYLAVQIHQLESVVTRLKNHKGFANKVHMITGDSDCNDATCFGRTTNAGALDGSVADSLCRCRWA